MKNASKKNNLVLKIALALVVLLLGAGLYFIYAVLPAKVAQGIFLKSQTRLALTETPKDYGVKNYQDVTFMTSEGITLSGWWLPLEKHEKPSGTILLTHGVFKNRQQVLPRALFFRKLGYQVLLFDQRGNGQSGNSPVSGGILEAGDFLAAEKYLDGKHELKKPIVFFGFSMGAMSALRAGTQASPLDAVIADSPLANLKSYVSRRTMGGIFSYLPGFLPACLKDYDQLTGLSLTAKDLDLIPVVEKLGETPVLYITGESDDLARSSEVRQLFQHTPAHHKWLVYMPDSGHEETYQKFPVVYEMKVKEFLDDLKKGFPQDDPLLQANNKATPISSN